MAHVNDSLKTMNDALAALQAQVSLLLASRAGMTAAEFEARIKAATQEAIDAVLAQLAGLDVTALQVAQTITRKVLTQINAYGPDKFLFEFFDTQYSVADQFSRSGVTTVAGDDSVDISDTIGITVGREYVIETPEHSVVVQIRDILSTTRFRCTAQIPYSLAAATLRRTNWTFASYRGTAKGGQAYYSQLVSLDLTAETKALVIRRKDSAAILRVYYRLSTQDAWTEVGWLWARDHTYELADYGLMTAGPAEGEIDYEYALPVRGAFELKVVCEIPDGVDSATTVDVVHIVGLNAATGLGGVHRPPAPPANISPLAGATSVGPAPTLQLSAYVHPALTDQGGADFRVRKAGVTSWDYPLYAVSLSGVISGCPMPIGIEQVSTAYEWCGRYRDNAGGIGDWSTPTQYTTAASFPTLIVGTPSITSPANGATKVSATPTLTGTAFSATGGDATQSARQYQISTSPEFSNIVYDSGLDTVNKSSRTIPETNALPDGVYYARIRDQGDFGSSNVVLSEWSGMIVFEVKVIINNIVSYSTSKNYARFNTSRIDANGNVVSVGSYLPTTNYTDAVAVKLQKNGQLVFSKGVGGSNNEDFLAACIAPDGAIFAVGTERSSKSYSDRALIAKISADGTTWVVKSFGSNNPSIFHSVCVDTDGNVYACGELLNSSSLTGLLVVKFSSDLSTVEWAKTAYDTTRQQHFTPQGMVIANGMLHIVGPCEMGTSLLAKMSLAGAITLTKSYARYRYDTFSSVAVTDGGSAIAVGYEDNINGSTGCNALICKINADGSLGAPALFGGAQNDYFTSVAIGPDGYIYVVGYESSDTGIVNGIVLKFTIDLLPVWKKKLWGGVPVYFNSVDTTMPGQLCLSGYWGTNPSALSIVIDTDASDCTGTIPDITQLTWADSGLSILSDTTIFTVSNVTLTTADSSISMIAPGLTVADVTLQSTSSNF